MKRPEYRLIEKEVEFWWPPHWFMRLTCRAWGHRDIWDERYPHVQVCRYCSKDMLP